MAELKRLNIDILVQHCGGLSKLYFIKELNLSWKDIERIESNTFKGLINLEGLYCL